MLTKESILALEPVFEDDFDNKSDVEAQYNVTLGDNITILYAQYEYADYSGSSYVFGYDSEAESFFEVHGSHCSCYGLEGQWDEELITVEELQLTIDRFARTDGFYGWLAKADRVFE